MSDRVITGYLMEVTTRIEVTIDYHYDICFYI